MLGRRARQCSSRDQLRSCQHSEKLGQMTKLKLTGRSEVFEVVALIKVIRLVKFKYSRSLLVYVAIIIKTATTFVRTDRVTEV